MNVPKSKRKRVSYIVKSNDVLSQWETNDLSEAYRHAVYLSRLEDDVVIQEVVSRVIVRFKNGDVCNE